MARAQTVGSLRSKPNTHFQKCGAVLGRDRLLWQRVGNALALFQGKSEKPLLHVEPDAIWPGMFRVRSGSEISDMVNLTRAKDAAVTIALRDLNSKAQEKPSRASYVRRKPRRVGVPQADGNRAPEASKKLRGFG